MKQKTIRIFILLGISFGLLHGCTERIDIELEQEFTRLSVEGYVTADKNTFQFVRLTKTAGYFSNEPPPPVSGATVSVDDGTNLFMFTEDQQNPGYYRPPQDFQGIPGKKYQLSVELAEEIAGTTHFEATETMPPLSDDIDSIRIIYRSDFDFWAIKFYGYDPPGPNFYMFNAIRNGVLITDSIQKVNVTDDKLVDNSYINGAYVMILDRTELNPGDQFTLITSSISEEYYNYILGLQAELHPKNPLFSGPPANVTTNLSSGGVGYFAAFPSAYTDYIVRPF